MEFEMKRRIIKILKVTGSVVVSFTVIINLPNKASSSNPLTDMSNWVESISATELCSFSVNERSSMVEKTVGDTT